VFSRPLRTHIMHVRKIHIDFKHFIGWELDKINTLSFLLTLLSDFYISVFWKLFLGIFFSRILCVAFRRCGDFVPMFLVQIRINTLVRYPTWHYVRTALVIRSDGKPLRVKSFSPCAARLPHSLFLIFVYCAIFLGAFDALFSRALILCDFSPLQVCFLTLFIDYF